MITEKTQSSVVPLARWLHERFGEDLVEVILFGSSARGEADVDSDIDLLLLFKRQLTADERREISEHRYDLDLENGTVTQLVIETDDVWHDPIHQATLFWEEVQREGIKL